MINKIRTKGFTLIETLVAVLLLTTAVAGPLTIASKGLTATLVAKNQFTAFYLAQDGIEQVRFIRDSNALCLASGGACTASATWLSLLDQCVSANGSAVCNIDSIQATVCTQGTANCAAIMNYDSTGHYFSYTTGSPSKERFIRSISIQNDPAGVTTPVNEAIVTVTVSWSDIAGVTRKPITVRENIFKWQ